MPDGKAHWDHRVCSTALACTVCRYLQRTGCTWAGFSPASPLVLSLRRMQALGLRRGWKSLTRMHTHFQLSGKELCAATVLAWLCNLTIILCHLEDMEPQKFAFLSESHWQAEKCWSGFQKPMFHSCSSSPWEPASKSAGPLASSGLWQCSNGYTNQ